MGNLIGGNALPSKSAPIRAFYNDGAWIEGAALQQANHVATLPGIQALALFPDLHPGKYGPTGMAALSDRLYPQLIGNDIGCGMALFELNLPMRKFKLDRAEQRLRAMMDHEPFDPREELEAAGLPATLWPGTLGDIGGGNHFCEAQMVGEVIDANAAFNRDHVYLLVHSGSRGLGASVFERVQAVRLNDGLDADSEAAQDYMMLHDQAVRWAALNRELIAARAAATLGAQAQLIVDTPHNLVRRVADGLIHHKGAAFVENGGLAPVAGSRAAASYMVQATGVETSLGAISHGAGRKYDRATMHGRIGRTRTEREDLMRNRWGGKLICDDRNLVIEEAAVAYKDAAKVVADLEAFGLAEAVAEMRPLLTYKKANVEPEAPSGGDHWRRTRAQSARKEARHGR